MPGPSWNDDQPGDLARVERNCESLLTDLLATTPQRTLPTLADVRDWHARIYDGCRVPAVGYVGNFRGDGDHAELVGYEVGIGPPLGDGLLEKVGVWSTQLAEQLHTFEGGLARALPLLDRMLPAGQRPTTADELHAVVSLIAEVHGEWVRLHPFANGNGRTARTWAAFIAFRYGLPAFLALRPRPDDVAYLRAGRASMGRPPDFVGDHTEAVAVFGRMLSLSLLP